MRVDRDPAAVVDNRNPAARLDADFDEGGVAGHRLVHRIVDDLGEEVVQGSFVGAADIHAGAAADGLEPLQDLDRGGGITAFARRSVEAGRGVARGSAAHSWLTRCCTTEKIRALRHAPLHL